MIARRSVQLTGGSVLPLPAHLVRAEQGEHQNNLGDCPPCRGTGTVVILMCLAGQPYTPVKDCSSCEGTGWTDKVERSPHVPTVHHRLP
jgi:hypothetical protein